MAKYAWTDIKAGEKSAKAGDSVTASGLGLSDEQFEQLVDAGSVRDEKYPDMGDFPGSPVEYAKKQLAIQSGQVAEDETDGVGVPDKDDKK
jgi:hypothetical protein